MHPSIAGEWFIIRFWSHHHQPSSIPNLFLTEIIRSFVMTYLTICRCQNLINSLYSHKGHLNFVSFWKISEDYCNKYILNCYDKWWKRVFRYLFFYKKSYCTHAHIWHNQKYFHFGRPLPTVLQEKSLSYNYYVIDNANNATKKWQEILYICIQKLAYLISHSSIFY